MKILQNKILANNPSFLENGDLNEEESMNVDTEALTEGEDN